MYRKTIVQKNIVERIHCLVFYTACRGSMVERNNIRQRNYTRSYFFSLGLDLFCKVRMTRLFHKPSTILSLQLSA